MEKNTLTRRQMVQRMALAIGGTLVAPTVLLESCSFDPDTSTAGPERLAILDAIAETIIPRTATAGARDARIGAFIDVMIRDCYYPDMQAKLNAGIQEIAAEGNRALGGAFEEADQTQRESVLSVYDAAAATDGLHFFRTLKELTMLGYFTSEEAAADGVINYEPVPTRYDGCAPVDENTKVFYSNI
ncbi:gluconate 2-dehydrogenase subunit 3 family protein [Schleiferiaceae bacterium]|nr:gluconate 2-dehydrogenase subunit 3 family protein [Schleiferiaceae bacterium]